MEPKHVSVNSKHEIYPLSLNPLFFMDDLKIVAKLQIEITSLVKTLKLCLQWF